MIKTFYNGNIKPLVEDLGNENRSLAWTYLGLAALFLLYLYLGKYAFMSQGGYGLLPTGASGTFYRYVGWFLSCFLFLFLVPVLFIGLNPKLRLKDYGLGLGDMKYAGKIALFVSGAMILTVIILAFSGNNDFLKYYPMFARGLHPLQQPGHLLVKDFVMYFVIFEVSYLFYFIGWEFYFRSLLIFPLEKKLGNMAVVVGILPFAIMHAGGKPIVEAFGSIVAAYLLGIIVLKVRSFWICPIIHFMVAFAMDLASALVRGLL